MAKAESTSSSSTSSSSNPTRKLLMVLGGVVVLIILVAIGSRAFSGGEDAIEVEIAESQVRAITQTVTASGQVRPEVEVAISSDVSGEIVFLGVEEGDFVQRGQLLIRVQPDFYASQREQAQAGVLSAQADVERARADVGLTDAEISRLNTELGRTEQLVERGAVGSAELDAARAAITAAQSQRNIAVANQRAADYRVQSARATLRQASQELGKTSIYAPISGTVSQLNVELGERVVGTAQMAGTEIMRIAELDLMMLEVDVNENDVVNIELADSARIEIDAYTDTPLSGTVTQIANSARVSGLGTQEQVTNFPVEVRILGSGTALPVTNAVQSVAALPAEESITPGGALPTLRPGMSGTVDIFTRTIPNAVVVPLQAVTVRDFNEIRREEQRRARRESGNDEEDGADTAVEENIPEEEDLRRVVFVLEEGKAVMREVETGIQDDTHIEVRSGLSGAEKVITGPFRMLRTELEDGDAVEEREDAVGSDEEGGE